MAAGNLTLEDINQQEVDTLLAPIVYLSILMVIGIPGNITVLLIYWKRYSRCVYRTLILSLCFTDLFFCFMALPFNIVRIVRYYTFYSVWACKIFTTLTLFDIFLSSHLILILSFHRFRQVCMPLKSQINPTNIRYWIAGGIMFAVILDIPEFILQPVDQVSLGQNITGFVCAVSFKNSFTAKVYNGFSTGLFVSYTLTLCIFYLLIGRKMYMQRKSKRYTRTKDVEVTSRITKIAITVGVVFALSYIPLFVLKLMVDVISKEHLNNMAFSFLKILERSYAINHVANPFIYAFFDHRFRSHFRSLVSNPLRISSRDKLTSFEHSSKNDDKTTTDTSLDTL